MSEIPKMQRVIVESPYAGDIDRNVRYVRACMRDCLLRGESPYASHALYTQEGVLRDEIQEERMYGIAAGFAWREAADKTVVYLDLGISKGMTYGIAHARELGHPIEERYLGSGWDVYAPRDPFIKERITTIKDGVTETVLILTDEAKQGLTVGAGIKIPPVEAK